MDRKFELQVLDEALDIMKKESYMLGENKVFLHYSEKEREQTKVYLPEQVHEICDQIDTSETAYVMGRCGFGVHNMDSFTGAAWQYKNLEYSFSDKHAKTLVLNFANPVHPGGGVRKGARAQEEDLCRKSTLLQSLESKGADHYYEYHRQQHTYLESDAMILSPNVEVFFDHNYNLLEEPLHRRIDFAVLDRTKDLYNYNAFILNFENFYRDEEKERGNKYGSVKEHINTSKGCGGVMRVAPLGIHYDRIEDDRLCMEGAEIAAVNHDGDSDSTGSATGNIVGAWIGYDGIDMKWKENLELSDVILEVAEDLCHGCTMSEYSSYRDIAWETKYIHMQPYHKH